MDESNLSDVVESKVCNAKITNASPSFGCYIVAGAGGGLVGAAVTGVVLKVFKSMTCGLWVGGRIFLTTSYLLFEPNKVNKFLHDNVGVVKIPVGEINAVEREFGFVTGIVRVCTEHGDFKFRCYGAREFADKIKLILNC